MYILKNSYKFGFLFFIDIHAFLPFWYTRHGDVAVMIVVHLCNFVLIMCVVTERFCCCILILCICVSYVCCD
jgi:hypothetical protein